MNVYAHGMSQPRVLIVDDSATVRRAALQALRGTGLELVTAHDGHSGLLEARTMRPDLVLLDVSLPDIEPDAFLRALHAEVQDLRIRAPWSPRVVVMSARGEESADTLCRDPAVVGRVSKPLSPDLLAETVRRSIAQQPGSGRRDAPAEARLAPPTAGEAIIHATAARGVLPGADPFDWLRKKVVDVLQAHDVADSNGVATAICALLESERPNDALAARPQHPVVLTGDLAHVPLPEVLQLIHFQSQTGTLVVSAEGDGPDSTRMRCDVGVRGGRVVSVRTQPSRVDLRLGRYLVSCGLVTRPQLDATLAQPSSVPLGQRLVERGAVTTEQLRRQLGAQAHDTMVELLRTRRGTFTLLCGEDALPPLHIAPGIPIDVLMLEAMRTIDEWSVIEQSIPGLDARFVRCRSDNSMVSPEDSVVLDHWKHDADLSIRDVVSMSSMRAFDICRVVCRLLEQHHLARTSDGRGPRPTVPPDTRNAHADDQTADARAPHANPHAAGFDGSGSHATAG